MQEPLPAFGRVPVVLPEPAAVPVRNEKEMQALPATVTSIVLMEYLQEEVLCAKLQTLAKLESLEVGYGASLPAAAVVALANCPALRRISCPHEFCGTDTQEGLDALTKLKALEFLDCKFVRGSLTPVISVLATCPKLSVLRLNGTRRFGDAESKPEPVKGFAGLAALRELQIHGSEIHAETMAGIAALPMLQKLDLPHSALLEGADAPLGLLAHRLERLGMTYCRLPKGASFELKAGDGEKVADLPLRLRDLDLSCAIHADAESCDAMVASVGRLVSLVRLDLSCLAEDPGQPGTVTGRARAESVARLAALGEAKYIRLDGHHVDAAVLKQLAAGAIHLEFLSMSYCPDGGLTPEALAALGSFQLLVSVDLSYTCAGTTHAGALAAVQKPLELSFRGCRGFGDDACEKLSASATIVSVDVSLCPVSDKGVRSLAKMAGLTRLNLAGCNRCTPGSWPSMPKLEVLWLDDCGIGDKGFPTASKLPKLVALSMSVGPRTRLTGEAVAKAAKFRNLRYLDISGVKPTEAQLAELKGLSKLEWLVLGESGLIKDNKPVAAPLGTGGFGKIARIDVRLFRGMDDDPDSIGIGEFRERMGLGDRLADALRKRFPGAIVKVRKELTGG